MINYNKNELIRVWLEEYYSTFEETCGTADYVPKKYNAAILRYIFKNMKRQSKKLDKEDRKYQRQFRKRQRRKRREKRKRERERRRAAQRQEKNKQREDIPCRPTTAREGDMERRNVVEPREVN